MENLTPQALAQVADYFQALAEPNRLRMLNLLRHEPRSVGELALETGHSVANVSRHLALLAQRGLLARETRGTSVYYHIADPAIYELCNLVCDNLGRRFDRTAEQRAAFAPPAQVAGPAKAPKVRNASKAPEPRARAGKSRRA
ncbi:MAG: winged helix-turn-helix transcriptional regulator [Burkholderiales bacterium]|nr:winged helix-turn-helix transcriptional regulator [Burkholderiales bacterium]